MIHNSCPSTRPHLPNYMRNATADNIVIIPVSCKVAWFSQPLEWGQVNPTIFYCGTTDGRKTTTNGKKNKLCSTMSPIFRRPATLGTRLPKFWRPNFWLLPKCKLLFLNPPSRQAAAAAQWSETAVLGKKVKMFSNFWKLTWFMTY